MLRGIEPLEIKKGPEFIVPDGNSAEGNSSTILLFNFDGEECLLSADAGFSALEKAAKTMDEYEVALQGLSFIQLSQRGARGFVETRTLNRFLGPSREIRVEEPTTVFVSNSEEKDFEPCEILSFSDHGARVVALGGTTKSLYSDGMPDREGWTEVACSSKHEIFEVNGQHVEKHVV